MGRGAGVLEKLTERQLEIYQYINGYQKQHGYPPSRKEIAKGVNIHSSTLRAHLLTMEKKAAITWNERIPRSITLLNLYPIK